MTTTLLQKQKQFFATGATLSIAFRRKQLNNLSKALSQWEKRIVDALWTDLHKSYEEAYMSEISMTMAEVKEAARRVGCWAHREWVRPNSAVWPSMNYVVKEPLGTALIVSPWNYPVQLALCPLVGAMAAGCTAVLKPSPYVPHVSQVLADMIAETFSEEYIAVVQGHRDVNEQLLSLPFDLIFYTGSPAVAHTVMEAAAKHLTPVVLELGGKSPCIVDKTADVCIAARRLAWAKTMNAGQTCVAPDYLLIHPDVKEAFVKAFERSVHEMHGEDVQQSKHFVRMVSDKAFDRVSSYLAQGNVLVGGHTDAGDRYIEPTLLDNVALDAPVMTEEIFGPVLPMVTLSGDNFHQDVLQFVNSRPKPLAFYYYGRQSDGWQLIGRTSSGGACINDSLMHCANTHLPFGGVGHSGMGRYHGKESFDCFTNRRSVLVAPHRIDLPMRYMPYSLFKIIKRMI